MDTNAAIAEVKEFNRFYARVLGLLDRDASDSELSLAEARILAEVDGLGRGTANQICSSLDMDRSYASRIINRLENDGMLLRHVKSDDRRCMEIEVTEAGHAALREAMGRSDARIAHVISSLSPEERDELAGAMRAIERYISAAVPGTR